jgi:intracellular septation protein A
MLYAVSHLIGDFLTAIVFIAGFATTGNLPLAIGVTVAVAAGQIGFNLWRGVKPDAMVWLSLFLAIAFGGASLIADDPRFVMMKPSVIHLAIACVMVRRGWMLRYLDERARSHVPEPVIIASGYGWALFMVALAVTNVIVALTASFTTWAWFVSAGLLLAKVAAFGVQYLVFRLSARPTLAPSSSITP